MPVCVKSRNWPETVSLETPVGSEERVIWQIFIEDEIHRCLLMKLRIRTAQRMISEVTLDKIKCEREQKVLRMRFGLDDGHGIPFEGSGSELNVTRERSDRLRAKALRKPRALKVI